MRCLQLHRWRLQGLDHHHSVIDHPRPPRTGQVLKPGDPFDPVTLPPVDHRLPGHLNPPGDLGIRQTLPGQHTIRARCTVPARIAGDRVIDSNRDL